MFLTADSGEFQLGFRRSSCQIDFGSRCGVPDKLKRELPDFRCHGRCAANRDRKPVTTRVAAGTGLALRGDRSRAPGGVSSVGRDLLRRCHGGGSVGGAMVPPAGPGREHEPCRSAADRLHQLLVAFSAPALQFPDGSLAADLVLEGEVFDVNESIDRRLRSDPVDIGFDKAVLPH